MPGKKITLMLKVKGVSTCQQCEKYVVKNDRVCFSVLLKCILPSGLYNAPAMFKRVTKGAFHLSELAGQTSQSVNRMRHFE